MQKHHSFFQKEQEKTQGKTGAQEILQVLQKKHFTQGSKIDF